MSSAIIILPFKAKIIASEMRVQFSIKRGHGAILITFAAQKVNHVVILCILNTNKFRFNQLLSKYKKKFDKFNYISPLYKYKIFRINKLNRH